jgi:GT2 family glycosyltransferase
MIRQNINNGISVIILTWNSEEYIERCISSLIIDLNLTKKKFEIFIVDNGSMDKTLAILETLGKKYEQIYVIKSEKNLGTTISRNIGLKKSKGKYIFILDSDTEIKKGTIDILIKAIDRENKAGIIAPRIFYPDGAVQHSFKKFPILHMKILKFLPINSIKNFAEKDELYQNTFQKKDKKIKEVDYCISAAWLVNRKAIEDIGFFDEKIFYSPEDVDYCVRMWLKGWKVLYQPSTSIVHYAQRKSYTNLRIAYQHLRGLLYYFRKYNYWFSRRKLYRKLKRREAI